MRKATILLLVICAVALMSAAGAKVILNEGFESLQGWKNVYFPGIHIHTSYTPYKEGGMTCLKAESIKSASAFEWKTRFNPYEYPYLKWKWKIENILPAADLTKKSGDDATIRVYISFAYDPARAGIFEKAKYSAAKSILGYYPPHSSLNYIWSSQTGLPEIITSAYSGNSKMILLENGGKDAGRWLSEEVNIISDYRRAFNEDPPDKANIGILCDTENTGGKAVSYITDITLFQCPKN